jgi:malonyl-CoA O-methyltransferase
MTAVAIGAQRLGPEPAADLAQGCKGGAGCHRVNILAHAFDAARRTAMKTSTRPADAPALARIERRLAAGAEAPWLHQETARRMAERLSIVKRRPDCIVDWHARAGGGLGLLRQAYPRAQLFAVESHAAPMALSAPWWSAARWRERPPATIGPEAVPAASAGLLWSNMALHWQADPAALLRRWQAALAVDGFLMFSTLGPGSLPQLRALYQARGFGAPMAPLVDMHDLGDMLVEAGFADPVMDQERLTLTWPDARAALAELRSLGANASPQRHPGLRTPRWRTALEAALAQAAAAPGGRIALEIELVYGHAFKPPPRVKAGAETTIDVEQMRAMMRQRRSGA